MFSSWEVLNRAHLQTAGPVSRACCALPSDRKLTTKYGVIGSVIGHMSWSDPEGFPFCNRLFILGSRGVKGGNGWLNGPTGCGAIARGPKIHRKIRNTPAVVEVQGFPDPTGPKSWGDGPNAAGGLDRRSARLRCDRRPAHRSGRRSSLQGARSRSRRCAEPSPRAAVDVRD